MKQYRDPEMEIILLSENDVIVTSNEQGETEWVTRRRNIRSTHRKTVNS